MRDHSTPLYRTLAASGVKAPTVVPSANQESVTFNVIGLPAFVDDMRAYCQCGVIRFTTVFDSDAAGSAVLWDQLYKGLSSVRWTSPVLGDVYPASHTRGAVLGHLIQVIANGYSYPQPARAQIATNTDADTTLDLYYVLPLANETFIKPHETAQAMQLFEQGEIEVKIGATTVYDGDYAGAVIKATTTVRAWLEYLPSPDNYIGVPFQWREYIITGNSTEFILRGVGGANGLKGIANKGAGLVSLMWLTDATGIGLSGADGVDEINRIDIPWRFQQSIETVDPYFLSLRRMHRHRVGPIAGNGTTILHDGAGWPYTMAATPNNSVANAQALILPIIMPGPNFETSKAQHVDGDLTINLGFGTTPSGSSRFVTLELLEWDVPQLEIMTAAMGIKSSTIKPRRKLANGPARVNQARYTRIMLDT